MATVLSLCQSSNKYQAQKNEIEAQLSAVKQKVQAAFDSLNDYEAKEQIRVLQEAVAEHNQLFTGTPAGSLNGALADAGLTRLDFSQREAEKTVEREGLLFMKSGMYVCNPIKIQKYFTRADSNSQVLPGLTASNDDAIQTPRYKSLVGMKTGLPDSCTGTYNANGTVDQLREIFKGVGGDLTALKRFVESMWTYGISVVWSMPYTIEVHRPEGVDSFDFDVVRSQLSFPAYDEDINIIDDIAYVMAEHYVTDSESRAVAEAKARDLATSLGIKGTPALFCRFVRSADSEESSAGCITLMTSGFDASKFGLSSYVLGISVNGIRREIDVTGDRGSNSIFSEYSADIIAHNINVVYGPHLTAVAFGGEIKFIITDSGPKSSIEFFKSTEFDASEAVGVNGMLNNSVSNSNRVGSVANDSSLKLDGSFLAKWIGGKSKASAISDSLASSIKEYGISNQQASCMLAQSSYWEAVVQSVSEQAESLERICNAQQSVEDWVKASRPAVRAIERILGFVDIPDFRTQEARKIIAELGDDSLLDLLNRRPEVDMIDTTFSKGDITSILASIMNSHADANAVIDTSNDNGITQVSPFRQNRGKLAYACGLFNFIDDNLQVVDASTLHSLKEAFCDYVPSLVVSTESITKKSQHGSVGKTVSSFLDCIQDLCNAFGRNIGSLLMDSNAPAKAVSAIVDFACRQAPDTCEKVQELYDFMNRNKDRLLNAVSSVEDAVFGTMGDILDSVLGSALGGLVYVVDLLSRLLEEGTAIVEATKSRVTGFFQGVFNRPGQSLPSILADLANLSYNVYGDFSVKTKFMSCYASGSASATVGIVFNKVFEMINTVIGKIIDKVDAVVKSLTEALSVIQCIADKLMQSFQGFSSYEMSGAGTYKAAGMIPVPVSFTLQCTISYGYQAPDPGISRAIQRLSAAITALGASLKLQTIKFNTLSTSATIFKSLEIAQQTAASTIIEEARSAIVAKLESLLTC
jgi:hypothetical protein